MGALSSLRSLVLGEGVRVPMRQADSQVECAAASLAMVLAYYGREVSIPEAHERCNIGRDGASARDIAEAARSYGLRVNPYSMEIDELVDVPCPAVLHWRFQHFVVLEDFDGQTATIADPIGERREVSRKELSDSFTGVVLTMTPGEGFAPEGEGEGEPAWRMIASRAFRAPGVRRLLAQILVASLVLQLLGLSVPLLTKVVVDEIIPLQIDSVMGIVGLGILIVLGSQLTLAFLRGLVLVNFQAKLDSELMTGFFEHVLALPYRYFQEHSTGDLLQRLSSNAQIRSVLSNQTVTAVLDGSFVVVYGLLLLLISPIFGLVALVLGGGQILLLVLTARRMTALVVTELTAQGTSEAFLVESISSIETLKSAGAEPRALTHWTGVLGEQLEATMRRGRLTVVIGTITATVQGFSSLLMLWIGALLVLNGSMSLGTMLALVSLAGLLLAPLASLVAAGIAIQQVGGHLERIASVLRATPEQQRSAVRQPPQLEGEISLDGVSFRYDESADWAVRDLSMDVRRGQKVALVGRTGSGKTTVAKLVLGLYAPTEGEVRVDGQSLHDLDLRMVRSQFGVVSQETKLINGSIRRNISYNDPSLPLEHIVRAAQLAELHEDIEAMPMGYETLIAEGGSALSGGQRQRLAIARALARRPRLLVLDEATSDLDAATERNVANHLSAQGASMLIIAHRLSTVEAADLILVLEGGRAIERGTHGELLAAGGRYAELVRDQLVRSDPPLATKG